MSSEVIFQISVCLLVGTVINYPGIRGANNLYIISVTGIKEWLKRLPAAGGGEMVMATVKKGKPELTKIKTIWQW